MIKQVKGLSADNLIKTCKIMQERQKLWQFDTFAN